MLNNESCRILRMREVQLKIGVARSTLYDWSDPRSPRFDKTFPKPIKLGGNSVGWINGEIEDWICRRAASRKNIY
jgi:prophage regulatory protein